MTDFDELKQTKAQCLLDITEALPDYVNRLNSIDAELIRQACAVHLYIKAHREELSQYNPSNGWGSYDNLLKCSGDFVKVLLDIPAEEYDNYLLYCWT